MSEIKPREERLGSATMLMLVAASLFTCTGTAAKWLEIAGIAVLQIAFARYFVHFLLTLLSNRPNNLALTIRSNRPTIQCARSLALLGNTVFNFLALKYLPITTNTAIAYAGPLVVILLTLPILQEKLDGRKVLTVFVGFIGALSVVQPWDTGVSAALLLSIAALLCESLYFVLTRMLAGIDSNATMQLWSSGIPTLVLFPFMPFSWTWPDSIEVWSVLLTIGIFGASAHTAAAIAHRFAKASTLAPILYSQIFFATVSGILVFDTWPTLWTLVGGSLIIISSLFLWQIERRGQLSLKKDLVHDLKTANPNSPEVASSI